MKGKVQKIFLFMIIGIMLIALAACGGNESAQPATTNNDGEKEGKSSEISEIKVRFAHNMPAEHLMSKGVDMFADLVSEKSDGKVKITVFPSGQLYDDTSMAEAVTSGQVEMGMSVITMWAGQMPSVEVYSLPLFPNYDAIHEGLENGIHNIFEKELNKIGAQPLFWPDYGFGYYSSTKDPLSTPENFKGKRIRALSPMGARKIELSGGTPVTMGGGEVQQALQRGTIDGAVSGVTSFASRQYYQFTNYYTGPEAAGVYTVSANLDWWNTLSEADQELINEAAKEAEDWVKSEIVKEEEAAMEILESEGMKFVEPDREAFKEINEQVIQEFIEKNGEIGEELVKVAREAMENNQ